MSGDYSQLPDDLPVPVDDGAADGLVGQAVPRLALPATSGGESVSGGRSVGSAADGSAGSRSPGRTVDAAGGSPADDRDPPAEDCDPPANDRDLLANGRGLRLDELAADLLVAYVYPMTGTPGVPLPHGWDDIPGARGCTPQSCAYRDALGGFERLGAAVVGISAQAPAEQAEFAAREHIPFPLLSDDGLRLREAPGLPTFEVDGRALYRRLTFVAERGRIVKVFYPVFPPDRDAGEVLAWLRDAAGSEAR